MTLQYISLPLHICSLPTGNDSYNYSIGFFASWLISCLVRYFAKELYKIADIMTFSASFYKWIHFVGKVVLLSLMLFSFPPLLMGLWFDFTFVGPFSMGYFETPKYSFLRAWVLGLVFIKVIIR